MEIFHFLLTILFGAVLFYIYVHLRRIYFFKAKGIEYTAPIPFFGNSTPYIFRRTSLCDVLNEHYQKHRGLKYFGFFDFMSPVIGIRDPELFASIAVQHFDSFMDHPSIIDSSADPLLGRSLFQQTGDTWRKLRKSVSPCFTLSKIKMMFELIRECAENYANLIIEDSKTDKEYDMKDIYGRYTTDVVASCAFGIGIDSMRNPSNEFYSVGSKALDIDGVATLKVFLSKSFPFLSKVFGMDIFGRKMHNFFLKLVSDAVRVREEKGIVRPDFIQLMISARNEGMDLTVEDITAQAFVFFFSGFHASATTLCFMFYEIALHPEIQETLRKEIDEVMIQTNGQPTSEVIMNMKYMDAVVNETLRKYPLLVFLDRVCTKKFELPSPKPGGKPVIIKPGTYLYFLIHAAQNDPEHYDNPMKFDPERFLDKKSNLLTFGLGPRVCIGIRFALMQMKTIMFYFLAKCVVEPCAKTSVPMTFSKRSYFLTAENGFWLRVKKREFSSENNNVLKTHHFV